MIPRRSKRQIKKDLQWSVDENWLLREKLIGEKMWDIKYILAETNRTEFNLLNERKSIHFTVVTAGEKIHNRQTRCVDDSEIQWNYTKNMYYW